MTGNCEYFSYIKGASGELVALLYFSRADVWRRIAYLSLGLDLCRRLPLSVPGRTRLTFPGVVRDRESVRL